MLHNSIAGLMCIIHIPYHVTSLTLRTFIFSKIGGTSLQSRVYTVITVFYKIYSFFSLHKVSFFVQQFLLSIFPIILLLLRYEQYLNDSHFSTLSIL